MNIEDIGKFSDLLSKKSQSCLLPSEEKKTYLWYIDTIKIALDQQGLLESMLNCNTTDQLLEVLQKHKICLKEKYPTPPTYQCKCGELQIPDIVEYLDNRDREEKDREKFIWECDHDGDLDIPKSACLIVNTEHLVEISYTEYRTHCHWKLTIFTYWGHENPTLRVECTNTRNQRINCDDNSYKYKDEKKMYYSKIEREFKNLTYNDIEELLESTRNATKLIKEEIEYRYS